MGSGRRPPTKGQDTHLRKPRGLGNGRRIVRSRTRTRFFKGPFSQFDVQEHASEKKADNQAGNISQITEILISPIPLPIEIFIKSLHCLFFLMSRIVCRHDAQGNVCLSIFQEKIDQTKVEKVQQALDEHHNGHESPLMG